MLSKNKIKFIKSLESKKQRIESGLFLAEGEKLTMEIIQSGLELTYIAATHDWLEANGSEASRRCREVESVSREEMSRISFLKTPQSVVCLVKMPQYSLDVETLGGNLSLLLDTIQDPGNLGTILRIADWYGIEHVICTRESADAFNPKVVQSTMGAICRVKVFYEDFSALLPLLKSQNIPIYGTVLGGTNIHEAGLSKNGLIMMGNESKGIAAEWEGYLDKRLFIPFYPEGAKRSESLNVAVAAALVCSEFRRRG